MARLDVYAHRSTLARSSLTTKICCGSPCIKVWSADTCACKDRHARTMPPTMPPPGAHPSHTARTHRSRTPHPETRHLQSLGFELKAGECLGWPSERMEALEVADRFGMSASAQETRGRGGSRSVSSTLRSLGLAGFGGPRNLRKHPKTSESTERLDCFSVKTQRKAPDASAVPGTGCPRRRWR